MVQLAQASESSEESASVFGLDQAVRGASAVAQEQHWCLVVDFAAVAEMLVVVLVLTHETLGVLA